MLPEEPPSLIEIIYLVVNQLATTANWAVEAMAAITELSSCLNQDYVLIGRTSGSSYSGSIQPLSAT